ncbi:MAG: nicotinate-nucleotide adenylyltransferase [Clostridia bacterium]|nr:nicotinate-nucleotide adenylyltransferase [Clostridia bacterium]
MKTGIMGGTFNPIHQGHIEMMEAAAKEAGLEYILLIPTGNPPHKTEEVISKYDRYEMCMLAAASMDNVIVSSIEIERNGSTYTIDTLKELEKKFGKMDELFFIIGADTVMKLRTWKNFAEVSKRCSFIAFYRNDTDKEGIEAEILGLMEDFGAKVLLLETRVMDVSSSDIRDRVQKSLPIGGMVPGPVEEYIKRNGIYSSGK